MLGHVHLQSVVGIITRFRTLTSTQENLVLSNIHLLSNIYAYIHIHICIIKHTTKKQTQKIKTTIAYKQRHLKTSKCTIKGPSKLPAHFTGSPDWYRKQQSTYLSTNSEPTLLAVQTGTESNSLPTCLPTVSPLYWQSRLVQKATVYLLVYQQ